MRLGDFVEVLCDTPIPADILLLQSSDPGGVCYIETATLDGETNLKQRQAVLQTHQSTTEVRPQAVCGDRFSSNNCVGSNAVLLWAAQKDTLKLNMLACSVLQDVGLYEPDTLHGEVHCEQPHENIYEFNGYM